MRTALVTGVSGQDGSYLSESLLAAGWAVHGLVRAASAAHEQPIDPRVITHTGDLADEARLRAVVADVAPDVIFNLAGVSSVAQSWQQPVLTAELTGVAAVTLLDAAWQLQEASGTPVRFVQASSAEIFGAASQLPQNEDTPIRPVSPYGAAKAFAHHAVGVYRARGLGASAAVLYNHESPRRPETFVTRKITRGAALIAAGQSDTLMLGNLDARRDWGWAPDYVDALIRMAEAPEADDFVIATGRAHTVREFVAAAFRAVGIEDWQRHVGLDPRFARPSDAPEMCGDASKARELLGWQPSVEFDELVARMAAHDLAALRQ
ncbi:GDP-mannose 4,6-dehydratase [Microterricola viridarii]|uniref:GDP-mannose 4,6-dehydratase n=1 Tax=Microterricola viridarii TaxID=412690 RepID=A0A0Y0NDM0_9MICO|nr:GDP-mannose 4,6-dehydratase [Microterricola viridarii]AMB57851.1 GDP-mannose 4,6 dehydratase [Microterricola viridarii]